MSTILVTGGAGYVGSHICRELLRSGHQPIVLDDLSTGRRELAPSTGFTRGDIADEKVLSEVLTENSVEAIVHCAARSLVEESVRNPELYRKVNVDKTEILLNCALQHGVRKVIFSSSCAVFGEPNQVPIPEDHPIQPSHPYGDSKARVESLLTALHQEKGLQYLALRYFNAAGADLEGGIGEWHDPETHLIPIVLDVACGQRPSVTVFGIDYATPDGSCVRDYVHVNDLARAHVLGIHHLENGGESGALNLGTGQGYSVREIVAHAERISGNKIRVEEGPRRQGDPPALVCEIGRAKSWLNWEPQYSDLETILKTAWKWHIRDDDA